MATVDDDKPVDTRPWREADNGLGCLFTAMAIALLVWLFAWGGFDLINQLIRHWAGIG